MSLRVISYGGGVQSTALVVLATQGKIGQVDAALFANVGDDSEHPETVRYVRDLMVPWAADRGLPVHELHRQKRTGEVETLYGRLVKNDSRSLPIPVRMPNGAPGRRGCTDDFKVSVVTKWLKANGASKSNKANVLIGFSTDEAHRVNNQSERDYELLQHPLLDLRLNREDCKRVIERAGLPVPPKSACYFCPFHRPAQWARMRRDEPDLFSRSVKLERLMNKRRAARGMDSVYLTRFGKPLDEAIAERQPDLPLEAPDTDSCDEGYCWT
tara:strand:+ start:117 stop:926 length:810 start_codon:yes stop_codon:yes gene_type:complete